MHCVISQSDVDARLTFIVHFLKLVPLQLDLLDNVQRGVEETVNAVLDARGLRPFR